LFGTLTCNCTAEEASKEGVPYRSSYNFTFSHPKIASLSKETDYIDIWALFWFMVNVYEQVDVQRGALRIVGVYDSKSCKSFDGVHLTMRSPGSPLVTLTKTISITRIQSTELTRNQACNLTFLQLYWAVLAWRLSSLSANVANTPSIFKPNELSSCGAVPHTLILGTPSNAAAILLGKSFLLVGGFHQRVNLALRMNTLAFQNADLVASH
jgi:hypothetical protein